MFYFFDRYFIVLTFPLSRFLFSLLHFEISKFGASKIVCLKKKSITKCFQLHMFIIAFYFIVDFYIKKSSFFGGRGVGFFHGL
jgi:hypothetical protein